MSFKFCNLYVFQIFRHYPNKRVLSDMTGTGLHEEIYSSEALVENVSAQSFTATRSATPRMHRKSRMYGVGDHGFRA